VPCLETRRGKYRCSRTLRRKPAFIPANSSNRLASRLYQLKTAPPLASDHPTSNGRRAGPLRSAGDDPAQTELIPALGTLVRFSELAATRAIRSNDCSNRIKICVLRLHCLNSQCLISHYDLENGVAVSMSPPKGRCVPACPTHESIAPRHGSNCPPEENPAGGCRGKPGGEGRDLEVQPGFLATTWGDEHQTG